jgi:hypothetical protein
VNTSSASETVGASFLSAEPNEIVIKQVNSRPESNPKLEYRELIFYFFIFVNCL